MDSSEDFRACSVFPTYAEVVGGERAPLQASVVDGPVGSTQQYRETHFWLLREQVVGPLRKAVGQLRGNNYRTKMLATARFLWSKKDERRKGFKIVVSDPRVSVDKEKTQGPKLGSLVCFTCNNFETLLFATISCTDESYRSKSQVFVRFTEKYRENIFKKRYLMIESETFFGSYKPVLEALQRTEDGQFPLIRYFVGACKSDRLPRYLASSPGKISVRGVQVEPSDRGSWPAAADIGLDASQLATLQAALTRELAFVTGPPGSGKTFTALRLAEILIENRSALKLRKPILVVSNTNHSLDKFLLALLKVTKNIVRVGGQSKFRQLNAYNYNKLAGTWNKRVSDKDAIGMTACKAAEWRTKLDALGCQIVFIEDATVLYDAQLFACLSNQCQHLILIGGEKQLGLKLEDPDLAQYNLGVSFFERMLRNRASQEPLQLQYRMHPQIAKLVSPLIYPAMEHGASVEGLRVLAKRVSFVTHEFAESVEEVEVRVSEHKTKRWQLGNSKKNDEEAAFVVALCKYLLKQNVSPLDVTVLTTYACQSSLVKKLLEEEKSPIEALPKIKVATVDNFQGGENKIVILSLVRSNASGALGFLEEENRIGVALSKARNALVMVGNMKTLSKCSPAWQSVKKALLGQNALDRSLELSCIANPSIKHVFSFEELINSQRIDNAESTAAEEDVPCVKCSNATKFD